VNGKLLLSCGLGVFVSLALAAGVGYSQVPVENHYKTYEYLPPSPIEVSGPITLTDQFSTVTIESVTLKRFGIPADKNGEGFDDPLRHQTWWEFTQPEEVRRFTALDQFGVYSWRTRDSKFLLCPAGKNQTEIPEGNHYKCYEADDAPLVDIEVTLTDQVDEVVVMVLRGKFFCNPVEKSIPGAVYPILDGVTHMTCYEVRNPEGYIFREDMVVDQFGQWELDLGENKYLCVPALKDDVVGTEHSTWGRIKSLYQ
jgi:hypothetical protein